MQKITITETGQVFGPFHTVETTSDRYVCDGAHLPFSVVGEGVVSGWVGDEPLPVAAPVVPVEITMRQARLVLLGAGKLAAVDTAIAAMPEPNKSAAEIEWEYSNTVMRHNGFVSALGPMLGLTDAEIDALFVAGAKL